MSKKIIALLCTIALVFSLCACGSASPTDVAGKFFDAVKAQDIETIKTVYANPDDIEDIDSMMKKADISPEDMPKTVAYFTESVLPKALEFDYELSNEKVDGDKATVDVKVTTYTFGDALTASASELVSNLFVLALSDASDDQIDVTMKESLKKHFDSVEKTYTETATISLTKKNDEWIVDDVTENEEFINVILGGVVKAADEIDKMFDE